MLHTNELDMEIFFVFKAEFVTLWSLLLLHMYMYMLESLVFVQLLYHMNILKGYRTVSFIYPFDFPL